jgi:hypothetical protein
MIDPCQRSTLGGLPYASFTGARRSRPTGGSIRHARKVLQVRVDWIELDLVAALLVGGAAMPTSKLLKLVAIRESQICDPTVRTVGLDDWLRRLRTDRRHVES